MRGGRTALAALALCFSACSSAPPAEVPRDPETHAPTSSAPPEPLYRFTPSPVEGEPVPGGGLKAAPPATSAEDVVKLQREVLARHPASDEEKLRLALLLASTGELEEAERIFGTMKAPGGKLAPYLELFLRRQLGEHREASKALAQLVEEERRATGFVIDRAELCTKVRRFRDYAPAESDRVAAGGVVLLYVEPRNFTQSKQGDRHTVHLRYDWKLFDDRSTEVPVPVWDQADPAQKEDRLSTVGPVAEFYQSFRLPLPAGLAAGPYRVKVTVTDVLAGKTDRVYVPITVGAVER